MTRIPPVRQLLMDAKALIAKPECWCQRTFANDTFGRKVAWHSPAACRFCAYGAVLSAGQKIPETISCLATQILDAEAGGGILNFNDAPETTHPMVIRLFNKAIRRAEEQGI